MRGSAVSRDAGGEPVFETSASIEMDATACETLRLRSAVRALRGSTKATLHYRGFLRGEITFGRLLQPPRGEDGADPRGPRGAQRRARAAETRARGGDDPLGPCARPTGRDGPWVLIGGPPCQAYSLVGRSRRRNDVELRGRHKALPLPRVPGHHREAPATRLRHGERQGSHCRTPTGAADFSRILDDLSAGGTGYEIRSFVVSDDSNALFPSGLAPSDYMIRVEEYGVPQRRHRVILLGVRVDHAAVRSKTFDPTRGAYCAQAIGHLPRIGR